MDSPSISLSQRGPHCSLSSADRACPPHLAHVRTHAHTHRGEHTHTHTHTQIHTHLPCLLTWREWRWICALARPPAQLPQRKRSTAALMAIIIVRQRIRCPGRAGKPLGGPLPTRLYGRGVGHYYTSK